MMFKSTHISIPKFTLRLRLTCACLSVAITPVLLAQGQADDEREDLGRGEALYFERSCYACHGHNGTGSVPLANNASGITTTADLFINYLRLRADQNPVLPRTTMPNYAEDSLSDDDARHLYAYIRSLADTPPEVENIPALRQILEAAEDRQ